MKILIVYASKNGTGTLCVERLTEKLKNKDITAVNLERETADPSSYDIVVFGASVYFGKLRPAARKFLKQYEQILCSKSLALFLCCGLEEEYEHYVGKVFSPALRQAAFQTVYFGGSLRTDGLSLRDKLIIMSMRSSLFEADMDNGEYFADLPATLPENIDKLATLIHKEIGRLHAGQ